MMLVAKGQTDVSTYFHLRLTADGTDATGLTVTDFDLQYVRSGATPAAKVDASALGAANSAHADNSAIEVDPTDQPGVYRVDWPDAAFATGVDEVLLTVKCATAFTETLRVRLLSVTRGLSGTALPDAAAEAAGGLYTRGTGAGQINQAADGMVDTNPVRLNNVSQSLLDLKDFADDGYDPSTNKVQGVVLVDTATTLTNAPSDSAGVTTLLTRVTAAVALASTFTGITSLAQWLGLIAGKQAGDGTARTELRATGAGSGTYDETADSQEALRDRGDAAWITATGFATSGAVATLQTSVDDLPTNAELATSQAAADDATLAAIAALNNLSAAQVKTQVDTALTDIHLDHLLATTYDPASKPGAADALLNELVENDGGVARYTANALEQAPTGGSAPTAEEIADEVRVELATELGRMDVAVSTRATPAQVATELATYDGPTNAEMVARTLAAASYATAAAQATLQTSVDDLPTNAELATSQAAADDATLAQIALVKAKTDLIPAAPAAVGDIPTTAQIADKVLLRNLAGGSDGGRTVQDALRFNRNKFTIAGGTLTVYEEDDTTIAWTAVITQTAGDPVSASDPA
jgi:hypothetical protein